MGLIVKQVFNATSNPTAITTTVSGVAGNDLLVLGGYSNGYTFNGESRPVTLTSTNNLASVNFVVSGYLEDGSFTTETLTGLNNNTVTGSVIWKVVSSIVADDTFTAVSVGIPTTGLLDWVKLNTITPYFQSAFNVIVSGTIDYTLFGTTDVMKSFQNYDAYPAYGNKFEIASNYAFILTGARIVINSATTGATLTMITSQQGL